MAEVVRRHAPDAVLHTDAVQALSWLDVADAAAGADLISVSAHKFGGPKGVGALVVRPGVALAARQIGGGQERERRSGTQNVAGIAAMAAAARLTADRRVEDIARVAALRDRLADGLLAAVPDAVETGIGDGDRADRAAGLCHLCFPGVESEALLFLLDEAGVAASAASSCASGAAEPSHVLAAMGVPREQAAGSLRLSLGLVDHRRRRRPRALAVVPAAVDRSSRAAPMRVLVRHVRRGRLLGGGRAPGRGRATRSTGVTMKLWGGESDPGCCSVADVDDARRVADQLGIDHHVFNFGDDFDRHVVEPYVAAHAAGRTPNPCIECNRHLKFDRLLRRAEALGFDAVATGHHARVVERPDGTRRIARGADGAKDQSYVLHMLGPGRAGPGAAPGRRPDQGRGPGPGRRARPAHRGQARQPGRLLHRPRPGAGASSATASPLTPGPGRRRRRPPGRRGRRRRAGHRRPAPGPRPARPARSRAS